MLITDMRRLVLLAAFGLSGSLFLAACGESESSGEATLAAGRGLDRSPEADFSADDEMFELVLDTDANSDLERDLEGGVMGGGATEAELLAFLADLSDGISIADWRQMERYADANGDGVVSWEERRAMFERVVRAYAEANMDRFDTDGDGVLSEDELRAAGRELREQIGQQMRAQFQQVEDAKWDLDGDGQLTEAELAARDELYEQVRAEQQAARDERRAEVMATADADGDGELSRDERRSWWQAEQLRQYDADGDGVLSEDEQRRQADAMRVQREVAMFRNRYDSGLDGSVDSGDVQMFMDRFSSQHPHADINMDNLVDQSDLDMFTQQLALQEEVPETDTPAWGWGRGGGDRGRNRGGNDRRERRQSDDGA